MKRKKRWWLIPVLIPVILIAVFFGWRILRGRTVQASAGLLQQRTATVQRGTLEISLSGSGSVYPVIRKNLKVEVDGTVNEIFMEEGQAVQAGDVLLTLNKYDTDISARKLDNTLRQKELAYQTELEKIQEMTIEAPISGEIENLSIKTGDQVNNGTVLLTITDKTTLYAKVRFENALAEELQNSRVLMHIPEYMTTLPAQIIDVRQNAGYTDATVLVENPGVLKPGIEVWSEAQESEGSLKSTTGSLEWYSQETVKAKTAGIVETLNVAEGQGIEEGMSIITLYNQDSEVNLENVRLQVEEAKYNIEQSMIDTNKYMVTAPMDGYIISVSELLEGESVKEGAAVAVLLNMDEMEFTISIDELDVNKVEPGQRVIVTADAIEDSIQNPIIGEVKTVALEGNTQNGVTSYPVTIVVPGREGLRVGMNVDAKIEVAKQENTLMVPLEALQKRGDTYMVWVKREGAAQGAIGEPRGNNDGGNTDAAEQPGDENRAGQTSGDRNSQGFGNMTDEQRSELRQRMQEQMGDEGEAIQGRTGDASTYTGRAASDIREETSGIQSVVSSGNYYEGAVLVPVETGIYNESYMEITGGLNEGETVVLPQQVSNTATGTSQGNMPFGMDLPIGGFGGVSNNPAQGVRMR